MKPFSREIPGRHLLVVSILFVAGIIGMDIGRHAANSYALILSLLFSGSSMIPDSMKYPRLSVLQPMLGVAAVLTALAGLAYGLAQDLSADHLYPALYVAFGAMGTIAALRGRSGKNAFAVQLFWLLLFVIVFSSFSAHILCALLHIVLFDHILKRYGIDLTTSAGLLILCLLQLNALRDQPAIRSYYEKRTDRQIVAQQVVLTLCLGLIAGIGGAGILAKDSMRGMQGGLVDALQANSQNFIDTVVNATNNSEKIASLMSWGGTRGELLQDAAGQMLRLHGRDGVVSIRIKDENGNPIVSAGGNRDAYKLRARLHSRNAWLVWQDGLYLVSNSPYYRNGRRIGDIEVQTSLNQLDREFDRTQSFGKSGEVVLCVPDEDRMDCFPSNLHREVSRFPNRTGRNTLPMSYALHGKSGVTVGHDYRGKAVLAAYQPISDMGFGMVQKVDLDELFASARTQMFYAFAFLMAASGLVAWLSYRRTHPLVHDLILAEAYASTVLNNVPEAVVTTDESGVVRSFNFSARKVFGQGFVKKGQVFPLFAGVAEGMADGYFEESIYVEGGAKKRDGSFFPYELTAGKISFKGKQHYICVVRDLTERRQAELQLQESGRYTKNLLENLQTGVVVHAQDGSVKYMNRAATHFFGFEDGLKGQHIPDLFMRFLGEDGRAIPLQALPEHRVLANEQPFDDYVIGVEIEGLGSPRWALFSGFPDFDENGSVREVIVSFVDITDRRAAEQALQAAGVRLKHLNRLYQVLSEVNGATVRTRSRDELFRNIARIVVDCGGFSMAWIGLFRVEVDDIVPTVWHGHDAAYYLSRFESTGIMSLNGPAALAIREGTHQICQDIETDPHAASWRDEAMARGYRSSGSFPFKLRGNVTGIINLYADVAGYFNNDIVRLLEELCDAISFALEYLDEQGKREEAEALLRQVNADLERGVENRTRQLEAANAELEAFSYSVSHDLRAPLRSIDGFTEIFLKRYAERLDDEGRSYLTRVRKACSRMGELIEDLLKLSRVTLLEIRKEEFDLSLTAEGVIDVFNSADRKVEWVVQKGTMASCDGDLMKIALENLLGNAWKFTSSKADARIEFGSYDQDGKTVMYVRDNGVGFDMQYSSRLFGAFQRLHKFEEFEGAGIGLATVQRIIRKHGGRIWAEGRPGVGATFYFQI